jgi:hypothetical protein
MHFPVACNQLFAHSLSYLIYKKGAMLPVIGNLVNLKNFAISIFSRSAVIRNQSTAIA